MSAEALEGDGAPAPDQFECWKIVLPCTRAEAEALASRRPTRFPIMDEPPVLNTLEPDEDEARGLAARSLYARHEPEAADDRRGARAGALGGHAPANRWSRQVAAQDWVTLSQAGLEPIRAGRFLRPHAPRMADAVPRRRRSR